MTTTKTYACNLCRDKITEETGVGVQFISSTALKRTPVPMAENHLCKNCLKQLRTGNEFDSK